MKHLRFLATGAVLKEADERAAELVEKGTHVYISAADYRAKLDESAEKFTLAAAVRGPQTKRVTIEVPIKEYARLHMITDDVEALALRLLHEYAPAKKPAFDYRTQR